ncbi:hypothetical protein MMC26_003049 [Xylographa opegraphella]|nr:hypothetical protein [Xylographa opegraphella]
MTDAPIRTRNGTGKTPKYRASCDSCYEAKVRCSQARPNCARCLKQGFECIYGISLRAGKHRAESFRNSASVSSDRTTPVRTTPVTATTTSPVDSTVALLPPTQSPLEDTEIPDYWQQQLKDWVVESFGVPGAPNAVPTHHFDPHHQFLPGPENTHGLHSMGPESLSFSDIRNVEFPDILDEHKSTTFRKTQELGSASTPNYCPTSNTLSDGYLSCSKPHSDPGSPTSQQRRHRPNPSQESTTCHCFELIFTQFPLFQSANRPFDIELAQAKEAMSLCARVLSCSCKRKDYVCVLTVSLLLACIVSVFEREFTSTYNVSDPPTSASNDDFMQVDGSPTPLETTPRFSFGKFQLDVEDEWKLKKEVVWLQIQRVEGLVDSFREMIRRGGVARENWAGQGNAWEGLAEVLAQKVERLRMDWGALRRA